MAMAPLIINWPLSSVTGYGIYGLQILMQHLRRGGQGFALTDRPIPPIILPPPFDIQLAPLIEPAAAAARALEQEPERVLSFDAPVLHGVGSDFAGFRHQHRVNGKPNVGCAALEDAVAPPGWADYLRRYDMLIAISRWNAAFLSSLALDAPVHLCHQGIDTQIFFPPPRPPHNDRFTIYAGGKFEFRKGQDIVLAAFKRFHARHPDAQLVVAWHNFRAPDPAPFVETGPCHSVPRLTADGHDIDIKTWLRDEGLPEDSFIALPWLGSADIAKVLRLADVAIFPNRCEGGTNLVAMEAIACGVPTFVSANSGHRDLIELIGCNAFARQGPVRAPYGREGWGETDVEEVVAALEQTYSDPHAARQKAERAAQAMQRWDWSPQNERLLRFVFNET